MPKKTKQKCEILGKSNTEYFTERRIDNSVTITHDLSITKREPISFVKNLVVVEKTTRQFRVSELQIYQLLFPCYLFGDFMKFKVDKCLFLLKQYCIRLVFK